MSTYDFKFRVGDLMTVWRVEYVWHRDCRGLPPSHPWGATPDEPAYAEIGDVTLIHVGAMHVSCHYKYEPNKDRYTGDRDGYAISSGSLVWDAIESALHDRIVNSDQLQAEIELYELEPTNHI